MTSTSEGHQSRSSLNIYTRAAPAVSFIKPTAYPVLRAVSSMYAEVTPAPDGQLGPRTDRCPGLAYCCPAVLPTSPTVTGKIDNCRRRSVHTERQSERQSERASDQLLQQRTGKDPASKPTLTRCRRTHNVVRKYAGTTEYAGK